MNNDQADGVIRKPLIHGFYLYPLSKTKQTPSLFSIDLIAKAVIRAVPGAVTDIPISQLLFKR